MTQLRPISATDKRLILAAAATLVLLAVLPLFGSALVIDSLTFLFILIMFATMWNLMAGYAGLVSAITFQPRTSFGVQWSVFMLFMVLVGGIGTFIGPILGAVLFFTLQEIFGDFGAWYLAGMGIVATLFALYLPRGIVGLWLDRGCDEPLSQRKRVLVKE